jgi:hypothetical protein
LKSKAAGDGIEAISESMAPLPGEPIAAVNADSCPPGGEIACFFNELLDGFGLGFRALGLRPSRGAEWGVSDMLGRWDEENDARGGMFGITRGECERF